MKQYLFQIVTPYLLLFLFFCLDIWLFFAISKPASFLIFSFFIATLFARPFSWGQTIWTLVLLMSAALTTGLSIWWPLLLAVPACLTILPIRSHIFNHPLYPALAVGLCIAADLLILRPYLLGATTSTTYTIGVIFGSMMVTMLFSLKLKTGKIRQSLTHA